MATWAVSFVDTFLNELLNLPQSIQRKVTKAIKVLESDPISAQGDAKKLKGYSNNVYRARIGDYRLIYSFGQGWVKLLSVRKRDEQTYEAEVPAFEPPTAPPNLDTLKPQAQDVTEKPTQFQTVVPKEVSHYSSTSSNSSAILKTALPIELTKELLTRWQIPSEYWSAILQVQHSEALLDLPLPDRYLSRILDNLYPRAIEDIATQREYILHKPEDLDRFVEGDLSAFLLKLDPEQEKLRDFGSNGPTLVKGGPGTGKSTLALHRVKRLIDSGTKPVLFTTYTKALVVYSEQLLEQLLGQPPESAGVKVATVDSLTYSFYVRTFGQPRFAKEAHCLELLGKALQLAEIPATNPFDRQIRRQTLERLGLPYLLQEIQTVIEAWGVTNLEDYLAHDRRGRGIPLKPSIREAIWGVYQFWTALMAQSGYLTWEQLRLKALEIVQALPTPPYQAVIIDEAQDLSPVALRFLLALMPSLDKAYLTADASQSLYQRGFSWKQIHADLKVAGRTLVLRRNYRNTQQISAACTAILQNTEAGDSECIQQDPSPYQGDCPMVVLTDSLKQEIQAIHTFLTKSAKQFRLPISGSAVLCPGTDMGKTIAQNLASQGLDARFVTGDKIDINAPYIKVLTLHSAKGLEFPFVVVTGLKQGQLPYTDYNDTSLPPEEIASVLDEQRRLFYVGCSRAMRALMICGSKSRPSLFLDSLTAPCWQR